MICPHCGKVIQKQTREQRSRKFREWYIKSGRSKGRMSIDKIGLCLEDGCNNKPIGKSLRCEVCKARHHAEVNRLNMQEKRRRARNLRNEARIDTHN